MPPRKRHFRTGAYYHLFNRGAGRQSIFREHENYLYLLRLLQRVAEECEIAVVAYCLLPNHYHFLVRQMDDIPAGTVPRRVFGSYSQAFNRRYRRQGTLFEGPYKAIEVSSDDYLLHLCRYIHANPVRHGIAATPELWTYSNYLEWIGIRPGTLFDQQFVRRHFASPDRYRDFVRDYIVSSVQLPSGLGAYLATLDG